MTAAQHTPRPTASQLAVLKNLAAGRSAGAHLRGRSAMGGLTRTLGTMSRRGWIDGSVYSPRLSDAGRAALAQSEGSAS